MITARYPVVIYSNGIGDHLLTLPALRALTTLFPKRIGLICEPNARQTFFSELSFRTVYEINIHPLLINKEIDYASLAKHIGPCDLLISLNSWHSITITQIMNVLAPACSLGFFNKEFQIALPLDYTKHSAEMTFDMARYLEPSLQLDDFARPPILEIKYQRIAKTLRNAISASTKVMVVHADTRPEKMWPVKHFIDVLDLFLERCPGFVVFVVGSRNLGLDRGRLGNRVIPIFGLPLPASLSLVAEADLFLGIDSCMLHAADLFRIPGVGLFGPTNCIEWGFRFNRHRHVCGADGTMKSISVTDVIAALESLMEEHAR